MDFIIPNCISSFFNIYLSITWTRAIFLHFNGPKTYLVYEYIHIFANFYFLFSKKEHFKLFYLRFGFIVQWVLSFWWILFIMISQEKSLSLKMFEDGDTIAIFLDLSTFFFPFGILQNNSKIVRNIQGHVSSLGWDSTLSPGHSISWLFLPYKTFFN